MGVDDSPTTPPRSRRHEEAIELAAQQAKRHGMSEASFFDSVLGVRDDAEIYTRALHTIEARKVIVRTQPGKGKSSSLKPQPSKEGVDPWVVDASALAAQSRVECWCPSCLGSGGTRCASCKGVGRERCPRCDGRGTLASGAECPQCGGQKRVPCATCHGAQVPCAECRGAGEVESWLDLERSSRQEVCAHPMGAAARSHPRLLDVKDFDADPAQWPNPRIDDTGTMPAAALARELTPKMAGHERSVNIRVQRFQTVAHLVTYATALGTGVVLVSGAPPEVSASADWRAAELRRNLSLIIGALMVAAAVAFAVSYADRHPWYARVSSEPALIALCVCVALAASLTVSGALLASRARTPMRLWIPAGAAVLLAGVTSVLVTRGQPLASSAQAALQRGDLTSARLESEALLDLNRGPAEEILDALHERELRGAGGDLARAIELAGRPWYSAASAARARRFVITSGEEIARRSATPASLEVVAQTMRSVDPSVSDRLMRDASMLRARACAATGDGSCAREQVNRALQFGADPSETGSVLRSAQEHMLVRFRTIVARLSSDEAITPLEIQEAITLSEECTRYTHEATAPSADALRARLARAGAREAADAGVQHEPRRQRRRR